MFCKVDGTGWCWKLLEERLQSRSHRELQGDLDAVDAAVQAEIELWRGAKLVPAVFFDGRKRYF